MTFWEIIEQLSSEGFDGGWVVTGDKITQWTNETLPSQAMQDLFELQDTE